MPIDAPLTVDAPTAPGIAVTGARATRPRLDRFEVGLLTLFGALSMWVVGSDLVVMLTQGRRWTHTDGFFSGDQLQYLAWIQSSVHHGLISNLFVLRSTPADYFQPAIMLSALLVRLGMSSWLSLMLWKPVAVIAIFLAARALAAHCFGRTFDRRAALVLGLLFASLSDVYGNVGVIGDMMSMWQSWGYPFGLIAVALITFGMLAYGRARDSGALAWSPGLLGALAGTVHPWQGELMFLAVLLAELVRGRETVARLRVARLRAGRGRGLLGAAAGDPALRLAGVTLGLVAIPLLYYFALGHLDPVWRMSQAHAKHTFSSSAVLIAAAPLLVFALLGYRGRPADFLELLLRAWIPATLIIWVFSASALGATPLHAVNGLTLPMAVLAVAGIRRAPRRWTGWIPRPRLIACLAIAIGTVPATAYTIAYAHTYTNPTAGNADWITVGESHALDYLHADPTPGGVLSRFYLGEAIPGITGRQDFVGDCLWSEPNCGARFTMVEALLEGALSNTEARRFVSNSGARFLLIGCGPNVDPRRQLGDLVVATRRFGCATVLSLAPRGPARGPLAAGGAARGRVVLMSLAIGDGPL